MTRWEYLNLNQELVFGEHPVWLTSISPPWNEEYDYLRSEQSALAGADHRDEPLILQILGDDGWELTGVVTQRRTQSSDTAAFGDKTYNWIHGQATSTTYVFKRQKEPDAPRVWRPHNRVPGPPLPS